MDCADQSERADDATNDYNVISSGVDEALAYALGRYVLALSLRNDATNVAQSVSLSPDSLVLPPTPELRYSPLPSVEEISWSPMSMAARLPLEDDECSSPSYTPPATPHGGALQLLGVPELPPLREYYGVFWGEALSLPMADLPDLFCPPF